jgi:hypothetical protein
MAKNSEVSDSNNILKALLIIIVVIGIAYFIYYLYTQSMAPKKIMIAPSSNSIISEEHNRMMHLNQPSGKQQGSVNTRSGMVGTPQGMGNPIMNKIEMTHSENGGIIGSSNIEYFSQDPNSQADRNATNFPKDQLTAAELLPQDNSSLWAQVNPSGEGSLKDRNFLQSGYHIGINTVGQTLRNANLQLRSEPPCPQVKVSPWTQSTISPDLGRKPFEIGGCA